MILFYRVWVLSTISSSSCGVDKAVNALRKFVLVFFLVTTVGERKGKRFEQSVMLEFFAQGEMGFIFDISNDNKSYNKVYFQEMHLSGKYLEKK